MDLYARNDEQAFLAARDAAEEYAILYSRDHVKLVSDCGTGHFYVAPRPSTTKIKPTKFDPIARKRRTYHIATLS